jgi:hypothetical protein
MSVENIQIPQQKEFLKSLWPTSRLKWEHKFWIDVTGCTKILELCASLWVVKSCRLQSSVTCQPLRSGKSSISLRRAGCGGAPVTPVMTPTGEKVRVRRREWEREKAKTLEDDDTTGSPGNSTVNRSGRAVLKEGADVAVGKRTRKETPRERKRRRWEHSPRKKRNGEAPLGYSGRTALRRKQCDMSTHCWVTQQRLRNPLLNTSRPNTRYAQIGEAVFSPCRALSCRAEVHRALLHNMSRWRHTAPRSFPRQRSCKYADVTQEYSLWTRC